MRIRSIVGALALSLALMLAVAAPAAADVTAAISSLQSGQLYVDQAAGAKLDQSGASSSLSSSVKVAVLPSGSGDAGSLAQQIGQAIGGNVTVGVFVGHEFNARSNALCSGVATSLAARAVADNRTQLQSDNDLTNTIKDFATLVNSSPKGCSSGKTGDTGSGSSGSGSSGSSHGWLILAIFGLLGAGGVAALVGRRRRKDRAALADARAEVQPFYDRLAADVGSLQPGDNATARQALADASERFNSGGSQLATASTLAQVGGARRSLLEGLQATQTARRALGLDPGPDLPPIVASTAAQLTEPQQVTAGGQPVMGYPSYTPGAPYYFAGGGGYAGGWYSTPFWESLLIAEALTPGWGFGGGWGGGGWGGGWGGGGYGSGYDSGFDAGRDSAQDGGGGGDWGGGGGDWGGGGGDWGGGGGDWGGGGGDSGGGGSW